MTKGFQEMFQVQSAGKGIYNLCLSQPKELLKNFRFLVVDAFSSKPAEVES